HLFAGAVGTADHHQVLDLARLGRHADAQVDGTDRQGVAIPVTDRVVVTTAGAVNVEERGRAAALRSFGAGTGEHVDGVHVTTTRGLAAVALEGNDTGHEGSPAADAGTADHALAGGGLVEVQVPAHRIIRDRKSTRLNSSHVK